MKDAISMDSSGRMVLPKHVRERLNLRGGARLRADIVAGHIELTPVPGSAPQPLKNKGGIKVLGRTGARVDAAAAVAAERADTERRARASDDAAVP